MTGCYSRVVRGFARTTVLTLITAASVGLIGLISLIMQTEAAAEGMVLDRVVAVVNDDIILESDLALWMVYDEDVAAEMQKLQNPTEDQVLRKYDELRPMALDELIGRRLMLTHAAQFQLGATEA